MAFTQPIYINTGSYANDGTGVDLKTAFDYVNQNFTAIYNGVAVGSAANIGTGEGVFAQQANTVLEFKKIASGAGINVSSDGTTITVANTRVVQDDTAPTLGGNLTLNGHNITGNGSIIINSGDIESTVYGIDIRTVNLLAQVATGGDIDLGGILVESPINVDLGVF